ncbi:MAG: ABC transporter ATP-binding protein [Bacteroidota bacterium]|nr:ABC transporter ATP-binding protein [Bacteroidota bacterium]
MSSIIEIENISKQFIIGHESAERYTTLRDEISKRAKKVFSFSNQESGKKHQSSKEIFFALKNINFSVEQGDRLGIIGRNGAGKSTLLKILSRITEPSSGRIKIRGRVASLLEVGTGFHPELSGRENIFLNGAILGMTRSEIRRKFDEIVAFADIEKFLDTPVKRYSSGMYVRLAFAVAAYLEPEILIVDEVLAVGDVEFQKKCIGKMEDVSRNEGRTVLFVSHNMEALSRLCKSALLLEKGEMLSFSDTDSIISQYLLSRKNNREYSRNGTNEIQVRDISIKNKDESRSDTIVTFENCTMEMRCICHVDKVSNVSFAICLNNVQGHRITSLWTAYKAKTFNITKGEFAIMFKIENLKLLPGDYEIITYIESNGKEIERIDNYDRLFVKYTNNFGCTVEPNASQGTYIEDYLVSINKM